MSHDDIKPQVETHGLITLIPFGKLSQTASPPGSDVLRPHQNHSGMGQRDLALCQNRPVMERCDLASHQNHPEIGQRDLALPQNRPGMGHCDLALCQNHPTISSPVARKVPTGEWGQYKVKTWKMRESA